MRTLVIDAAQVVATVLYARWLDQHKTRIEPDHTDLEVIGGVAQCLVALAFRLRAVNTRRAALLLTLRSFAVAGGVIVLWYQGRQWQERRLAARERAQS